MTGGGWPEPYPGIAIFCAEHDRMRWRETHGWYDCPGWDGEGCETRVTALEISEILAGRPIGPGGIGRSSHLGLPIGWQSVRHAGGVDITIHGPGRMSEKLREAAEVNAGLRRRLAELGQEQP